MIAVRDHRVVLGAWPTPLTRLHRIEAALRIGALFAKRDDLSGFGLAASKTRALEYLVADALAEGADVLVAGGRAGSNFCPGIAAAAAAAGLDCELVMASETGPPVERRSTNMQLSLAAGAVLTNVRAVGDGIDAQIYARAEQLRESGRRPYAVPRGGSTPVGCQGFAQAAHELSAQLDEHAITPAAVVCAVGSGASYAGLLVGSAELGWGWPALGASVSRPAGQLTEHVRSLAQAASELRGGPPPSEVLVTDAIGPGHGLVTDEQRRLAELALRLEGLLLDDTYTAKSFALAVRTAQALQAPVIFWHTGGTVAALAQRTAGHD